MTLLRAPPGTSMTWSTSPAAVRKNGALRTMKSCSCSVVQRRRQVPESLAASDTVSAPGDTAASASMQETMSARREGSDCVSRPRPWSAMRRRRSAFAAGGLVGKSPRKKAAAEGGLGARRRRARGVGAGAGAGAGGANVLFGTKRSGAIGKEDLARVAVETRRADEPSPRREIGPNNASHGPLFLP